MTIYYVDPTGGGAGTSWDSPTDLATAFGSAGASDQVWVKAGTYNSPSGGFTPDTTVYFGFASSLTGTNGSVAGRQWWIDVSMVDGQGNERCFDVSSAANTVTLDGGKFINGDPPSGPGSCINFGGATLVVRNCFCNNNGSAAGSVAPQIRGDGGDLTVENTLVANGSACAVLIRGSGGVGVVKNCSFYNNNTDGATDDGDAVTAILSASITVYNCACDSLNQANYFVQRASGSVTATYCSLNGASYTGTGNANEDPAFQDPGNDVFDLSAGSPCIDSADGTNGTSADYYARSAYDDPGTSNTGTGTPAYKDRGFAEWIPLQATGVASAETFGSSSIEIALDGTGIASAEAFGSASISTAGQTLTATGIVSVEAVGSHALSVGPVTLLPTGLASAEAFGTPLLVSVLGPSAIASLEAFGAAAVSPGPVSLFASGVGSLEAFGSHAVAPGPVTLSPTGIASLEAFGTALVQSGAFLFPTGVASLETFGGAAISPGPVSLSAAGIGSAEAFGTAVVSAATILAAAGIGSAETFGAAVLSLGPVTLLPTGIASLEAFGSSLIVPGPVSLLPSGIVSAEAFGAAVIAKVLGPTGIASAEAFGTSALLLGPAMLLPTGIVSLEAFGAHLVIGGALLASAEVHYVDSRTPIFVVDSRAPVHYIDSRERPIVLSK